VDSKGQDPPAADLDGQPDGQGQQGGAARDQQAAQQGQLAADLNQLGLATQPLDVAQPALVADLLFGLGGLLDRLIRPLTSLLHGLLGRWRGRWRGAAGVQGGRHTECNAGIPAGPARSATDGHDLLLVLVGFVGREAGRG